MGNMLGMCRRGLEVQLNQVFIILPLSHPFQGSEKRGDRSRGFLHPATINATLKDIYLLQVASFNLPVFSQEKKKGKELICPHKDDQDKLCMLARTMWFPGYTPLFGLMHSCFFLIFFIMRLICHCNKFISDHKIACSVIRNIVFIVGRIAGPERGYTGELHFRRILYSGFLSFNSTVAYALIKLSFIFSEIEKLLFRMTLLIILR